MSELLGKHVLIGITAVGPSGEEVDSFQTHGTVEIVDERRIGIRRVGLPELFGLPPAPELFEPAEPGVYTLEATGEELQDPDYLVTVTVTVGDPDSLLELRGMGFVP